MRLQILEVARNDLIEGFYFYENKEKGLGDYFLANLYSDIESLKVFIHDCYRCVEPGLLTAPSNQY